MELHEIKHTISLAGSLSELLAIFDKLMTVHQNKPQPGSIGRASYVVTVKGAQVKTGFRLVEAAELVPSNTLDGRVNPAYPAALQPRDRTRIASLIQITRMAGNLRPVQLADSGLSSHGAPIIGPDMAVESGNGRTMAIIKAYAEGKAEGYRAYLADNAELYGFTPDKVQAMSAPVLVRQRLDEVDRVQFAKDSNIPDLQAMSPLEQARVDAEALGDKLMALFAPSDGGDLLAASNRAFIAAFMTEMGGEQAAGYLTADGRPTRQVVDRVQAAIFARAYQDQRLLALAVEEPDPEIRNVLTAMNTAAPEFIRMRQLSGEAHKQATGALVDGLEIIKEGDGLDDEAVDALVKATELVREAKAAGQDVADFLKQQGLFGEASPQAKALALFISQNNRSAKRMGQAFRWLAEEISQVLQGQALAVGDMFGGGEVDLFTVIERVNQRLEAEYHGGVSLQVGMFEGAGQASLPLSQAAAAATTLPELLALLDAHAAEPAPVAALPPFDAVMTVAVEALAQAGVTPETALEGRGALAREIRRLGLDGEIRAAIAADFEERVRQYADSLAEFVEHGLTSAEEAEQSTREFAERLRPHIEERQRLLAEALDKGERPPLDIMPLAFAEQLRQLEQQLAQDSGDKVMALVREHIASSPITAAQAKAWLAGVKLPGKASMQKRLLPGMTYDALKQRMMDFYRLVDGKITLTQIAARGRRASAKASGVITMGHRFDDKVLWHEMGHLVEFRNPEILAASKALLQKRARESPATGRTIKSLRKLTGRNYGASEKAIDDGFFEYYVGKVYGEDIDSATATEVVSMGLQMLVDPARAAELASKDYEHFAYTIGVLKTLRMDLPGGQA